MVIQNSMVAMDSYYRKSSCQMSAVSHTGWAGVIMNADKSAAKTPSVTDGVQTEQVTHKEDEVQESSYGTNLELLEALNRGSVQSSEKLQTLENNSEYEGQAKLEYAAFDNLIMLLFPDRQPESTRVSPLEIFHQLMNQFKDRLNSMMLSLGQSSGTNITGLSQIAPTQQWGAESVTYDLSYEREACIYSTAGQVTTGDGRTIDFDVSAVMSRSFCEYANVQINYSASALVDPLVVCLGEGSAEVTDQKFLFDIDADGEKDNITLLAETCGYLALDSNEDGAVNDGSELFGTRTGNGFEELRVYDMDNNGWIDENDEIFNKLRVWTKDTQGNDKLIALGVAGVGAIYLGNVSTQFSINSESTNETQAVVRNTGVYLTEEGSARLIQHLDMALDEPAADIA